MSPAGLAVRITLPFSDVSGTVRDWALKADQLVCYEHLGKKSGKRHVHLLMLGLVVDKERLKQVAKKNGLQGGGNEFWSFKTAKSETRRYITYMTEGKNDPMYNKGFEDDYLQACKEEYERGEAEPSREERMFKEFEDTVSMFVRETVDKYDHDSRMSKFPWYDGTYILRHAGKLQERARSWAFGHHKRIWSVRTATDAKMVFLTYCMRYDITIPNDIKSW